MEDIYDSLKRLRLPGMAECWKMIRETHKTDAVSLTEGLRLMLQSEKDQREDRKTSRLVKNAKFRYNATMEMVDFDSSRGKDKDRIMELSTCKFIRDGSSVLMTGASGTGKSFLATALGHHACLAGYSTIYLNMSKLLEKLTISRIDGSIAKFFDRMSEVQLLILDDFGMKKLDSNQLNDFMEIIEDRHNRRATIIASQLPLENWYDVMEKNKTIADAVLDRIIRTSYKFELKGDSLRK